MISQLSIQNFATIQNLNVTFHNGLNIMTGETGAGKSIIIEAISLALGSRADTAYVRTGCKKAVIQLVLDIKEYDEPVVLTREILSAGKSICRINDEIVTRSRLSEFCRSYVDIHGQYDHQSLLDPENHLALLDICFKSELGEIKETVASLFKEYTQAQARLSLLEKRKSDILRQKSFLEYEQQEISAVNPLPGEDRELEQTLSLLQNSGKIYENLTFSHELLYETEESITSLLGKVMGCLSDISGFDPSIQEFSETVSDCYYRLEDVSDQIRRFRDQIDFSPQRMDQVIDRLEQINHLKRKYGGSIEAVIAHKTELDTSLDLAENFDDQLKACSQKKEALFFSLKEQADRLSTLRRKAAAKIEQAINRELAELNFKNAVFQISFSDHHNASGEAPLTQNGYDCVEFLISTNKGEALKPLAKIASGGEISRIMLAFKRILGDFDQIPTMIFDEIDSGISGQAAAVVGRKLVQIAQNHQIICITHLPQIAVMGDHHYRIFKSSDETQTYTAIVPMDRDELIEEIARLSGSIELTQNALRNAEEMLELAKKNSAKN